MRDAVVLSLAFWCLIAGVVAWFFFGEVIFGVLFLGGGAVTIAGTVAEVLSEMEEE